MKRKLITKTFRPRARPGDKFTGRESPQKKSDCEHADIDKHYWCLDCGRDVSDVVIDRKYAEYEAFEGH